MTNASWRSNSFNGVDFEDIYVKWRSNFFSGVSVANDEWRSSCELRPECVLLDRRSLLVSYQLMRKSANERWRLSNGVL